MIYPEFVAYEEDKVTPRSIYYDQILGLMISKVQELERGNLALQQSNAELRQLIIPQ